LTRRGVSQDRIYEHARGIIYFLFDVIAQFALEEIIQDVYAHTRILEFVLAFYEVVRSHHIHDGSEISLNIHRVHKYDRR
jgi:hypothetical protein